METVVSEALGRGWKIMPKCPRQGGCYCDGSCEKKTFEPFTHGPTKPPTFPKGGRINGGINPPEEKPQLVVSKGETSWSFDLPATTERELEIVNACQELARVLLAKNADYGDSFKRQVQRHGMGYAVARLEEKTERAYGLTSGGKDSVGESLVDTFLDIGGYGVLTYIEAKRDAQGT